MINTTKKGAQQQAPKDRKTAPDWVAVRIAYVHSTLSLSQVAEDYGINRKAVEGRCEREGWVALRRQAQESMGAAVAARIAAEKTEELAAWNQNDIRVAKSLRQQIAKAVNDANAIAGEPLSARDIRALAGAAVDMQKMGRLALGATTENTGVSSPEGGAVAVESVTPAEYKAALREVLGEL